MDSSLLSLEVKSHDYNPGQPMFFGRERIKMGERKKIKKKIKKKKRWGKEESKRWKLS